MSSVIRISNLTKTINNRDILKRVSFGVQKGSIFGLIGPNGAGKTTLIRHLLGLYQPTEGKIGLDFANNKIGFMLHKTGLYSVLTVFQNLALYAEIYQVSDSKNRINYLLDTVGLLDRKDDKVSELSKGMKQKLVLARAILHKPEVLILDEPTAGLEIETKVWFRDFIKDFVNSGQKTVVISSHELSELEKICTDIVIIREGRLVESYDQSTFPEGVSLEELYLKSGGEKS